MNNNKINMIEFKIWNRKIINGYWKVSLIYFIGQILFLIIDKIKDPSYSILYFVVKYVLTPDIIIFIIMLVTEFCFKFFRKIEKYLSIIASLAISYTIFFNINFEVPGRQLALSLPILISLFYFDKRILLTTCFIDILTFFIIYVISPSQREIVSIYELIVISLSCIGSSVVGIGIVNRGIHLLDSIMTLAKNEEKLIVEKSIIDKLSKTDALTNLYNHRIFHEYADTVTEQSELYNFQMQLAIIDIDDFKKVNDTYGHWSGDIVLKEVSKVILGTITPDDLAARYGGEEFAVIFIGKDLEIVVSILEAIREAIMNISFEELGNKSVSVSIGVHDYHKGEGKEVLFKCADAALYKAKNQGKNMVVCSSI